MTNDELANAFRGLFDDLHSKIDALPVGPLKIRAGRLTALAHGALEELKAIAVDNSMVQPFSGGDAK